MRRIDVPARAVLALGTGVVSSLAGCLLYTDPINRPPVLTIDPPAVIRPGEPATFRATRSDPDEDGLSLRLEWGFAGGACPSTPEQFPDTDGAVFREEEDLTVPKEITTSVFCVWARVTDSHGARVSKQKTASPANRPPSAQIRLVKPIQAAQTYALFTSFHLQAIVDDLDVPDLAGLRHSFGLTRPLMAAPMLRECDEPGSLGSVQDLCFIATTPGTHRVRLSVSDPQNAEGTAVFEAVVAEDATPCIRDTEPRLMAPPEVLRWNPEEEHKLEVTRVVDDGEPYPNEDPRNEERLMPTFHWSVSVGDQPPVFDTSAAPGDLNAFTIPPDRYGSGQRIRVQVEVHDRNVERSTTALLACGSEPLCAPVPGCLQRVSWTVVFQ
jgi:hypothetical protein